MTTTVRECRHCCRPYRPERVLTYDRRGRIAGYADSGIPWCTDCLDGVIPGRWYRQDGQGGLVPVNGEVRT